MKKLILSILCWGLLAMFMVPANAIENTGAETMVLPGGPRGDVSFPHRQHQNALTDCNACHTLFPQVSGSIAALKSEGKLDNKQVMNKLCIKCHRAKRKAGEPAGPTSCKTCHIN